MIARPAKRQLASDSTAEVEALISKLQRGPVNEAWWHTAVAGLDNPQLQRAAAMLSKAPESSGAMAALTGHGALGRREPRFAVKAFQAAAAAGWRMPADRLALARAFIALRRFEDARTTLDDLEVSGYGEPDLAWARAVAACTAGDYTAALAHILPLQSLPAKTPINVPRRNVEWFTAYLEAACRRPVTNPIFRRSLGSRWSAAQRSVEAPIVFGVFDYKSPDLLSSSTNIGDVIQTIAVLRNLMRHQLHWSFDDPKVVVHAKRLAETWPEERRRKAPKARAHVAIVDRDETGSIASVHPGRDIWTIASGWFVHRAFGVSRPLPFAKSIRPIFLSFHLSQPDVLNDETVAYLRAHGPIGCRDQSTVLWLLNRGVDAFFSGCLTLTLDIGPAPERKGELSIDLGASVRATEAGQTHADPLLRSMRFETAISQALQQLERLASARHVTTSRLHAYLPCLALQTPVTFRPKNGWDRRFDGLTPLDDAGVAAIRDRLVRLVESVVTWILQGHAPEEIYSRWHELTLPEVKKAREQLQATLLGVDAMTSPKSNCPSAEPSTPKVASCDARPTVVFAFDQNVVKHVAPLMRSIQAHASEPVDYVFLHRGITDDDIGKLRQEFPHEAIQAVGMEGRLADVDIKLIAHTTISTMDRVFLPEILPNIDRVVYLDIDTIVLGDVTELARVDMAGHAIAARPAPNENRDTMVKGFEIAIARMKMPQALAFEFRRLVSASIDLWAPSFNAGVLVLSLDELRRAGFTNQVVGHIRRFGLHDQEALHLFIGNNYARLPAEWNVIPALEWVVRPKLIHWAGKAKPWSKRPLVLSDCWRRYANQRPQQGSPSASELVVE